MSCFLSRSKSRIISVCLLLMLSIITKAFAHQCLLISPKLSPAPGEKDVNSLRHTAAALLTPLTESVHTRGVMTTPLAIVLHVDVDSPVGFSTFPILPRGSCAVTPCEIRAACIACDRIATASAVWSVFFHTDVSTPACNQ